MFRHQRALMQFTIRAYLVLLIPFAVGVKSQESSQEHTMIHIAGGSFVMGDLLNEGLSIEAPTHQVTLNDFLMGSHEVTVRQFRAFVAETGYRSSAENERDPEKQMRLKEKLDQKEGFDAEAAMLYRQMLSFGGAHCIIPGEGPGWMFRSDADWSHPYLEQSDDHPVTCISWNDAASYCNWLSRKEGLPEAYDRSTGELLDGEGNPTSDVTTVKGYRLPTEAEWEYAARERGKKVRFGNGEDVARTCEIDFDAHEGDTSYVERGEWRQSTVPVGSFKPNSLGLYDMSGNVWEWCSDYLRTYRDQNEINPYESTGTRRAARGGRWGGTAGELRVAARFGWSSEDGCNNIGFRVARTP